MAERIALLGSTGSIGCQTLDVVRHSGSRFEVAVLTAHNNWERLAEQAREFLPQRVVIATEAHYAALKEALSDLPIEVHAGEAAVAQAVRESGADTAVNALVGYAGLAPTVAAVESGCKLALANKESLVVGGDIVMRQAAEKGVDILPIDSEHSAVFQCLTGEAPEHISRIILTASGGPFLHTPAAELEHVTAQQALRHPRWTMGPKITIDSATMMNKGFEVIEARWLFGVGEERIDVVVHPQSVVHSMVEFADCSIKAQLGCTDMRLPIQYALYYPERVGSPCERFDFRAFPRLDFLPLDEGKFPAVGLARECLRRGGVYGCVLNAANEVAVAAFLAGRIPYTGIVRTIERTLATTAADIARPTLEDYRHADAQARVVAGQYCR